jgi:hypothetical protein
MSKVGLLDDSPTFLVPISHQKSTKLKATKRSKGKSNSKKRIAKRQIGGKKTKKRTTSKQPRTKLQFGGKQKGKSTKNNKVQNSKIKGKKKCTKKSVCIEKEEMTHRSPRPGYSSHLDLFQLSDSDIPNTNSIYVPVYSQTNIREDQIPLEFQVSVKQGLFLFTLTNP